MADGLHRKIRATSRRWLPNSWVNRKEIFPCFSWPGFSTDLCLVFLSIWLNTGTGPVLGEPESSERLPVMCPSWHSHSLELFLLSRRCLGPELTGSFLSHRSGESALTIHNGPVRQSTESHKSKCQMRSQANGSVCSAFYCNHWQHSSSIFN